MAKPRAAGAWLLTLAIAGCGLLDPDDSRDRLEQARARWAAANLTSYEYIVQRLCFCQNVDPVRITVTNGQVTARVDTVTGNPISANEAALYPDVPGLFEVIEEAYGRADRIDVAYDPTYGYPTTAVIDFVENGIDDELTLKAAELRIVPIP